MPKTSIIFDIGGVLTDFDWDSFVAKYLDPETADIVTRAMWRNPDWVEFDKGSMTDEEVLKLFISSAPNYEAEIRLIFSKLGECPRDKASTVPLITTLRSKGYKIFFLSNYFEYLMHVFPLNFLPHFDGGVFSCYEHVVKPDKRIYEILCERYGLEKSECVFIDDSEKNVKGAEAVGMKAIWYNGESMDELLELIDEIERLDKNR
ncbi:HAD family hydrolase [Ruminococcus albus]|uniref:HAD-superfamily hydrolase, subfamily IA, variant 3 n=1 Tax=Ruminococcus albus (strain ATCC 27210 / DSM 20455 / JCM 14654 / NCDO 2250 / 7) TaxID=697329 RepID=E6UKS4_RUMA7|nr:HAD family phosphatase [Ruminococcus albus]ADU24270.1 HAD-superfamily hydrolase, subfamily IA, variant 3 [Ruminococcus albus 7 = DSM 20455]